MVKYSDVKIGDDVKFYALIESMQKRFTPNKSGYNERHRLGGAFHYILHMPPVFKQHIACRIQ